MPQNMINEKSEYLLRPNVTIPIKMMENARYLARIERKSQFGIFNHDVFVGIDDPKKYEDYATHFTIRELKEFFGNNANKYFKRVDLKVRGEENRELRKYLEQIKETRYD